MFAAAAAAAKGQAGVLRLGDRTAEDLQSIVPGGLGEAMRADQRLSNRKTRCPREKTRSQPSAQAALGSPQSGVLVLSARELQSILHDGSYRNCSGVLAPSPRAPFKAVDVASAAQHADDAHRPSASHDARFAGLRERDREWRRPLLASNLVLRVLVLRQTPFWADSARPTSPPNFTLPSSRITSSTRADGHRQRPPARASHPPILPSTPPPNSPLTRLLLADSRSRRGRFPRPHTDLDTAPGLHRPVKGFPMAQVLAPIVQTTGSITMLHSSADAYQNPPPAPQPHQQQRSAQRSQMYNSQNAGAGYRGASSAPIAPYAFSSTPQLRQDRSSSAPNQLPLQQPTQPAMTRLGHPNHPSSSSDSTVSTSTSSSRSTPAAQLTSKDDSIVGAEARRSTVDGFQGIQLSSSVPDLSLSLLDPPVKPSPDRYRRGTRRTDSSTSVTPSGTPAQQSPSLGSSASSGASKTTIQAPVAVAALQLPHRPGHLRSNSADDLQLPRTLSSEAVAKRYRRRSMSGLEVNTPAPSTAPAVSAPITQLAPTTKRPTQEFRPLSSSSRPTSSHERQSSAGSGVSTVSSRPTSSRKESPAQRGPVPKGSVNPPPRGSSDPSRRILTPSPLSHPVSPSDPSSPAAKPVEPTPAPPSPAMQHLSALNEREPNKGMKSRLRRAFSFGSAAELRRASAENNLSAERARLRKDKYQNDADAEQAAIIAKQEAAGIGAGIYSGQGGFTGSTDNLSISSTASSASIMLRKMGHGMKRGGKSIKGLFRPKSVIGVPAADTDVTQPSVAQVSMVTVEAERQKVNVNVDPHDQTGGGTGYPRLERNSLDAARSAPELGPPSLSAQDSYNRKSIVGGDRERAEVLSSMKKGILKRHGTNSVTSSPVLRAVDAASSLETPKSSAPSTPNDEHIRAGPVHIQGEDYFNKPSRPQNMSTRSLPNTPRGGPRNISFSPRLQFHDVWSASDYDRRGEISTCNRLTPMLAQQIKEELNTFKMEMEVHETSKPYTHFF
ncbi:hypothetical protein P154DRAFT_577996 [Amniculicola lignicola CBS 123094]|uniref:Protein BNI4 n=1 Tax=Amniculicola lignicola CBS 123094 TaxID=1392246 RepID=A0A6A5WE41_9PLEO|nr:hypothetical protein P154DRAFT_577996 [Amniculicola lignicola CBS 123094]